MTLNYHFNDCKLDSNTSKTFYKHVLKPKLSFSAMPIEQSIVFETLYTMILTNFTNLGSKSGIDNFLRGVTLWTSASAPQLRAIRKIKNLTLIGITYIISPSRETRVDIHA